METISDIISFILIAGATISATSILIVAVMWIRFWIDDTKKDLT